jgi:hypothetical protein
MPGEVAADLCLRSDGRFPWRARSCPLICITGNNLQSYVRWPRAVSSSVGYTKSLRVQVVPKSSSDNRVFHIEPKRRNADLASASKRDGFDMALPKHTSAFIRIYLRAHLPWALEVSFQTVHSVSCFSFCVRGNSRTAEVFPIICGTALRSTDNPQLIGFGYGWLLGQTVKPQSVVETAIDPADGGDRRGKVGGCAD